MEKLRAGLDALIAMTKKVNSPIDSRVTGKFLLINIPLFHEEAALPPLGLAYIAALLEEEGYNVDLFDANVLGLDRKAIVSYVRQVKPRFIGLSVMYSSFEFACTLTKDIKQLPFRTEIIWGGPHPSICPEASIVDGGADICVMGEGERTILELAELLHEGPEAWNDISGLCFRSGDEIKYTAPRELITDLDSIPYPAHHLLAMDRYRTLHTGKKQFCTIITSRGCPGRCMFCSRCIFGRRMRYRSIDNVIGEIELLLKIYQVEEIAILDNAFLEDRDRIIELCRRIREKGLKFNWRLGNGVRVDQVDEELLTIMKDAGCFDLAFGVESGDDEVLRKIGKNITTDHTRRAFRIAQKVGLTTIGFFQLGHPFDTIETMEKTIDLAIEIDPTYVQFAISTPLPGTALWNWVKHHGKEIADMKSIKIDIFGGNPYFGTENFTKEDVSRMYRRAYRRFYYRPSYIIKKLRLIHSWNDIFILIKGLFYLRCTQKNS